MVEKIPDVGKSERNIHSKPLRRKPYFTRGPKRNDPQPNSTYNLQLKTYYSSPIFIFISPFSLTFAPGAEIRSTYCDLLYCLPIGLKMLAVPVICLQYVVNKDYIIANLAKTGTNHLYIVMVNVCSINTWPGSRYQRQPESERHYSTVSIDYLDHILCGHLHALR